MIFALVTINERQSHKQYNPISPIADSDFSQLLPISFTNEADIRLFTTNDNTTLEYDDSVILTFTPSDPAVITGLEGVGEYVRTCASVNIVDNDRK